jgi:hypothetical protein
MKIIVSPKKNWKLMDGSSDEEKKVNGILAEAYVFSSVPADECLLDAKFILSIYKAQQDCLETARNTIKVYLGIQFLATPESCVNTLHEIELALTEDKNG